MTVTRKFIGWDNPVLPVAVDELITRYAAGSVCDLSRVIVVVPGRRAGRRLLELLVERTAETHPDFTPPRIETVGTLPEHLYENRHAFADRLVQDLVWIQALKAAGPEVLSEIIPAPPDERDAAAWMAMGGLIRQQHRELAADALDFSDVARACRDVSAEGEATRWQALRQIQEDYLERLLKLGFWDRQTARLVAVEKGECRTDRDIVLVGTVDLNRAMRQMLDQVPGRVLALIAAPDEIAARFDEYGCLRAETWAGVRLALRNDQVLVVDRPDDQAAATVRRIAGFEGRFRADDITVGVADERLVPHLQRRFDEFDVGTRWFEGCALRDTTPMRLLELLADFIEGLMPNNPDARAWNFDAFATLVRHPDMTRWIDRHARFPEPAEEHSPSPWLVQLDEYRSRYLQPTGGQWLGSVKRHDTLKPVWDCVIQLTWDLFLRDESGGRLLTQSLRLDGWADALRSVVRTVYADRAFDPDREHDSVVTTAIHRFDELLYEFETVATDILPQVNAAQAIRLVLDQCRGEFVPPPRDDDAVELLGWLELPLDDAPALIVTTFNEQFVPKSLTSDLFLPNRLRRRLDLNDNRRRYARDAYALSVVLGSREDACLIVGRRDDYGDPLTPSRLLFATAPEAIPERVLSFYPERTESTGPLLPPQLVAGASESQFVIPRPEPLKTPITRISVTAFKAYLECPYRYYLKYVLKLREVDDSPREMSPPSFGNVLHNVLDQFGRNAEIRDALDANDIRRFLHSTLDRLVKRRFGSVRTAAVNVQLLRIRLRLEKFAEWQAAWAAKGYRIRYAEGDDEENRSDTVDFDLGNGQSVHLHGRIDRIDQWRDSDQWIILDYKSSDGAKTPDDDHVSYKGAWKNLQLPLYRHLVKALPVTGETYQLGYILLPGDLDLTGESIATWTEAELEQADETARETARKIVAGEFWPPAESVPFPDLTRICQDAVFDRGGHE